MVFGRRKKQQSNTSSTSSFFRSPENSCLKHPTGSRNPRHSKPQHLHVQFGPVYIREYERVIGCNPSCSNGAPIGIGWRFIDLETPVSIQAMELNPNRRRHKVDLVLSRQERESLLIEWGFTLPEIVESIRATIRIKHQRRRTVNNARYERVWEDVVVKPASRIKRKFRNKNANTKLHDPDQHTMNVPVHAHDYDSAIDSVDSSYGEDRGVDVQPKIPVRYEDSTESMEDDSRLFTLEQEDAVVYVNHDDVQEDISSATTLGSDGNFEFLSRDTSFWELERNNSLYPKIARKAVAIVVSDEPMDDYSSEEGTFGHPPMNKQWSKPPLSVNRLVVHPIALFKVQGIINLMIHPNLLQFGTQLRRLHDIPDETVLEIVDDSPKSCAISRTAKRILAYSRGLDRWDSDDAIDTEDIPSPPSAPMRYISDTHQPSKAGETMQTVLSFNEERGCDLARSNSFDELWAEEDIAPPPSLPTRMISSEIAK